MRSERVPQRGQGEDSENKELVWEKVEEQGGSRSWQSAGHCKVWPVQLCVVITNSRWLCSCGGETRELHIKELKAKHVQSHHHNSVKHRKWRWTRCCIMSKITQQLGGRAGIVECVSPGPQYLTMPLCSISSHRQEDSGSSGLGISP